MATNSRGKNVFSINSSVLGQIGFFLSSLGVLCSDCLGLGQRSENLILLFLIVLMRSADLLCHPARLAREAAD